MVFIKFILVLVVLFADCDASGHDDNHHDHIRLHIPEFIEHDHHTKVITIHHHKPKKEHHHHHHHKPQIPHGPPKYHYNHHHSKSSSHTKGLHTTHLGQKSLGKHGHHGHQGKHGHSAHSLNSGHKVHGHKHYESPSSYDPPANFDSPSVNYAPASVNYNPGLSYGSDYGPFLPSVSNIPSPQVHGIEHTVQQVKVYNTIPGGLKTGGSGYEVIEQGDEGEDVFTSINSLPQSYPGAYGYENHAAADQSDPFSDILHSNTNQAPNANPFINALPQPSFTSLENFKVQSQSAEPISNVQQALYEPNSEDIGFENGGNDNYVIGHDISGPSAQSFADASQDDTPVTFSREAGVQHAINTGGIETVAY